jgi:hypothetical protein
MKMGKGGRYRDVQGEGCKGDPKGGHKQVN